eukprot:jgi/Ulvmu1/8137/UM040_0033.1
MLHEGDVGITQYANAAPPITGILRHRYSDFQVNEIDAQMRVARLREEEMYPLADATPPAPRRTFSFDNESAIQACVKQFSDLAGKEHADELLKLLNQFRQRELEKRASKAPKKQLEEIASEAPDAPAPNGDKSAASTDQPAQDGSQSGQPPEDNAKPERTEVAAEEPKKPATGNGKTQAKAAGSTPSAMFSGISDKAKRTELHAFFRQDLDLPRLVTDTVKNSDDSVDIRVMAQDDLKASVRKEQARDRAQHGGGRGGRGDRGRGGRGRGTGGRGEKRPRAAGALDARGLNSEQWQGRPQFTRCVLLKVNRDSHDALGAVASACRVRPAALGTAGTKDKRGVTTQFVTAHKVEPRQLAAANGHVTDVLLGGYGPAADGLRLGDLAGNLFTLLLRELPRGSRAAVCAAVDAVRATGFVNYFGLQRFGQGTVPTHAVGFALMAGQWEVAVKGILTGRPGEREELTDARRLFWEAGDPAGAAQQMPLRMSAERACLQALAKHGKDAWLQAVQAIPHKLRSMYMHAAQSFFWNSAASARVRLHGLRVVEGDLVLPNSPWPDGGHAADPLPATPVATESSAADAAGAGGGGKRRRKDDKGHTAQTRIDRVKAVTMEDVRDGRYSIEEVVLPMPGGDVEYPACLATGSSTATTADAGGGDAASDAAVADGGGAGVDAGGPVYEEIARRVGVSLTAAPHSVKEFLLTSLTGDYRRLVTVPRALRMAFVEYAGLDDEVLGAGAELAARWGAGARGPEGPQWPSRPAPLEEGNHLPPPPALPSAAAGAAPVQAVAAAAPAGEGKAAPAECAAGPADADGQAEQGGAAAAAAAEANAARPPVQPGDRRVGQDSEAGLGGGSGGAAPTWNRVEDACVVGDGRTLEQCAGGGFREAEEREAAAEGEQGEERRLGVVLTFALPASSYATMLTRELLKASTATGAHKAASAAAAAVQGGGGGGEGDAEGDDVGVEGVDE